MADVTMLTDQNASPDLQTPDETDMATEAELEEELEELIIEDFTIDGICGVY
ncbi:MAG TPA: mycofactocin precursor MftA [Ktedonobacteraceae bacterium]|nr:mycofactocin precursor MftA [Ktedonobacteraceae bacterium]